MTVSGAPTNPSVNIVLVGRIVRSRLPAYDLLVIENGPPSSAGMQAIAIEWKGAELLL